jgi:hypothetical protein
MAQKKFSHRQLAQLDTRQFGRDMRRITGERYEEDHQHSNRRDMAEEMARWY